MLKTIFRTIEFTVISGLVVGFIVLDYIFGSD